MNGKIISLYAKIQNDNNLREKICSFDSVQDAYEYATSIIDGYTIDEFKSGFEELNKCVETGTIPDELLAEVSAGAGSNTDSFRYLGVLTPEMIETFNHFRGSQFLMRMWLKMDRDPPSHIIRHEIRNLHR